MPVGPGVRAVASAATLAGLALVSAPALAAVPAQGSAVIAEFIGNVTRWLQYLASLVAVATVAYGGLRYAVAHSPRAQAEAWRLILAGLGGLVIALLAPTIVSLVQGLIPS